MKALNLNQMESVQGGTHACFLITAYIEINLEAGTFSGMDLADIVSNGGLSGCHPHF